MNSPNLPPLSRREALRWVLAASASIAQLRGQSPSGAAATAATAGAAKPYGTDPLVNRVYKPGDFWPLTCNADQLRNVAALADLILPSDEKSPAASAVGVPNFIDEWISAPYPQQQEDRKIIVEGLNWLETESQKRFQKAFADLPPAQQTQIADDICYLPKARPEFRSGAIFFGVFRTLAVGGYYTSNEGMKDIGYLGNLPQTSWNGPPAAVLQKLGLA